jgi:hypothetical protein
MRAPTERQGPGERPSKLAHEKVLRNKEKRRSATKKKDIDRMPTIFN